MVFQGVFYWETSFLKFWHMVTVQPSGFTVTKSAHFKVCLRQRGGFPATPIHWLLTAQLQAELLRYMHIREIKILTYEERYAKIDKKNLVL